MSRRAGLQKSFGHAIDGLKTASKDEPNFQVHIVLAAIALTLGFVLHIDRVEWIILLFTTSFVIILELLNTMMEAIVDLLHPNIHPKAKVAKDVSAGIVLVGACVSVIVGALIFIPKIFELYQLLNK